MNLDASQKELVVSGENALQNLQIINQNYLPNITIAAAQKPSKLPFLKDRFSENSLLFFICQNKVCNLPLHDLNQVLTQIKH